LFDRISILPSRINISINRIGQGRKNKITEKKNILGANTIHDLSGNTKIQ
jgi:hypothetical protein